MAHLFVSNTRGRSLDNVIICDVCFYGYMDGSVKKNALQEGVI